MFIDAATALAPSHPATAPANGPVISRQPPDEERSKRFGAELDKIRRRVESQIGKDDVDYIKKIRRISTSLEIAGRGVLHFSFEPIGFSAGVIVLWLHKQLEATEIGHMALHGCYDGLEGAKKFQSKTFKWKVPIDEPSWNEGHNRKHHQFTNIDGKDPDICFGPVRLTEQTRHRWINYLQLPITLSLIFPFFAFGINLHFTGLTEAYGARTPDDLDVLPDRSWKSLGLAHFRALRKCVPYYFKEFLLFPALAGPQFWKVALGNFLSEMMRDVYSAAAIFCGHVGGKIASYGKGTSARGRGQWCVMQVESASNFKVPLPLSILCGALNLQIEHHLFPRFPSNRLREIRPEVQSICEEFGVEYRNESWLRTLKGALKRIVLLSVKGDRPVLRRVGALLEEMT